ncbi:MAG: glycosyltransferase family 4 protein [Limnothrix sp. RL_2_0]|nr:glycosyltransferase family 4 protein [Limnothrix sp. RL_2_0]
MVKQNSLLVNLSVLFGKPTGIGIYLENLFPYLQSLNPTLLAAQNHQNFQCHLIPDNLTPDNGTRGHLRRLIWTQFQLPKIYQNLKSQLLFSPLPEAPLYTKCRFVTTSFDLIPLRFPNRLSALEIYHKYYTPEVFKQAKHIICISESTAKDLTKFHGISSNKITSILLAYDALHFRPLTKENSKYRDQACPYFLYIGRHDPYKNIGRILSAFSNLTLNIECQLWLVGPTDDRHTPLLRQQIAELGLTERVKFLDYIPYEDLPEIISGAIALVFPSLWEGFGLPILEAMGCGTPVITSNLASMPEVAGDAAILVDPYNTDEIADAMQAIADDSQLRAKLSELGLARAKLFSWEKTGKATVEVLERFL